MLRGRKGTIYICFCFFVFLCVCVCFFFFFFSFQNLFQIFDYPKLSGNPLIGQTRKEDAIHGWRMEYTDTGG